MRRIRVIPTLLIDRDGRLVKSVKFGRRTYIGDPINAVRIFNEKEVDELVLLDIDASREGREPAYATIEDIVSEAFMPVAYGGGVRTADEIGRLLRLGVEKVILSTAAFDRPALIGEAAERYGVQAVAVCLPVKKGLFGGSRVRVLSGRKDVALTPPAAARLVVEAGAGELIVYSIDRDGTFEGFDLEMIRQVADAVDVPVVACGGASSIEDMRRAVTDGHCQAVAAGSLFVYQGKTRGVLITYPEPERLERELYATLA
jgi:imidazole glycerol-phosphate synthase subunit HisF